VPRKIAGLMIRMTSWNMDLNGKEDINVTQKGFLSQQSRCLCIQKLTARLNFDVFLQQFKNVRKHSQF